MIIHYISLLVLTTVQPREERGWNNRRTMVAAQESFTLIGGEQLVTMQCAVMAVVCNITVGNSVTMACNSAGGNTTVEPSERASRSTVAAAAQENWGLLSSHQTPAASTLLTVTIGPVALRQWHQHQVQYQEASSPASRSINTSDTNSININTPGCYYWMNAGGILDVPPTFIQEWRQQKHLIHERNGLKGKNGLEMDNHFKFQHSSAPSDPNYYRTNTTNVSKPSE